MRRIDAKIADLETDVAANTEDREHRQEFWKIIRDRVLWFVVPAVLVGVIWLKEFSVVGLRMTK